MKRILLAGAAFAALTSASYAADPAYEAVDVWSGYYVGIQAGYAFKDVEVENVDDAVTFEIDDDDFVGGLYYGRNWQSGNVVYGLDSSISYMGFEEDNLGADALDVEAALLGISRLRIGYAADNFLIFIAGGLASTFVDVDDDANAEDDDSFALGFSVGGGVETKFSDNWSARLEYIYVNIEDDDVSLPTSGDIETDLEAHIVRGGVAYHF